MCVVVYTCQSHSLCIRHNVSATENCWDHLHLNRCGDLQTYRHTHHTTCMLHERFAEAVGTVHTHFVTLVPEVARDGRGEVQLGKRGHRGRAVVAGDLDPMLLAQLEGLQNTQQSSLAGMAAPNHNRSTTRQAHSQCTTACIYCRISPGTITGSFAIKYVRAAIYIYHIISSYHII